jgi:hypothetical protein
MKELNKICMVNKIHIEDIPAFTMQLMRHKLPFQHCVEQDLTAKYDYSHEIALKLEEYMPAHMFNSMA